MELASRTVSVLLGLVVAVFILWPITIPVGFGQAWWASKQIAAQSEPTPSPRPDAPAEPAAAPSPPTPLTSTPPSETPTQSAPAKPDEGKHALLAAERAEAERIAALNKDAKNQKDATPAAPPPATKLYYRVAVRDAGTLQSGGTTIRLIGITARDADAICKDKKGRNWQCGAAGKSALARLIHTRAVSCELPKSG